MVQASFQHEGNHGLLTIETHFGVTKTISCTKNDDEIFRLGGTAINEIMIYEGVILSLKDNSFRAFHGDSDFVSCGILSPEDWQENDLHCYAHEYYPLDMEGKRPGWLLAKNPIESAAYLFVNVDILDGGQNVIRRYRVSPFNGEFILING